MSQSGYTPIQLYRTTTAAAAPTAGNLVAGELAINTTDEKLYFKNTAGTVKLLASSAGASGSVTSVDVSGGTTGLSFSGGPVTSSGTITMAGTLGVANGGTGATSLAANYLIKGNGTSAASASGIYQNGSYFGIGTTGPATLLDAEETLNGQGGISYVNLSTGAASAAAISVEAGGSYFYHSVTRTTGVVQFRGVTSTTLNQDFNTQVFRSTGGSEYMRINSSGNVGIGTSSPSAKLHVRPTTDVNHLFSFSGASATYLAVNDASSAYVDCLKYANTFQFYTASTERMRILASGNVGVGTTSPATKLDVSGTARGTKLIAGATTGLGLSNIFEAYSATYGVLASLRSIPGDGINSYLNITTSASGVTLEENGSSYGSLMFSTGASERMRIDTSGNVGIGTASPASTAILDVQSTTKGVRFPNMTTTQKNAITPSAGTVVFDTTLSKLCVYSGAAWQTITSV